ncbi:hypothetical protein NRB20_44950 [Nocardia sp. RB20]|uniref:Uncharacterized protein n=2 Tax=Nocardia macrotermitis TaxID=2585198 RepID=A0A7K0D6K5_9NOCA|nr:hypothetical protein [Nocardia macrotermitis]
MIHPHHTIHRPLLPTLRAYLHHPLRRHPLTREERRNLATSTAHPAVYSASLGCHPHL